MTRPLFLGIDLGTSGCRAVVIDDCKRCITETAVSYAIGPQRQGERVEQAPQDWWQALEHLMEQLLPQINSKHIAAISLDGTSGTVLLTDKNGAALSTALMYNDNRAKTEAQQIAQSAPRDTAAQGTASGLAKLIWLLQHTDSEQNVLLAHQADWILWRLGAKVGSSDWNNCLKTGYDAVVGQWPQWVKDLLPASVQLPRVSAPGSPCGQLREDLARRWHLTRDTRLVTGTTDSTAAIFATGIQAPGEAVTSLGSTMVMKILAEKPVFAPEYGVYSQPYGKMWLVGGGSNSGGAVLRQFFSDEELENLTPQIDPEQTTDLDYYPLPAPGERFPVCDPNLEPRMAPAPVPEDKAVFLQALLEGMARIEYEAYRKLQELGCPWPTSIRTVGGGANNSTWSKLRAKLLQVPMFIPEHTQAAYGAALLALQGFEAQA